MLKEQEESIYNIIPKDVYVPSKPARYQSRYPPDIIPTGSTLGLRNSQKPKVRNCGGYYDEIFDDHPIICKYSTLGRPNGTNKLSPDRFLKKGEGSQSIFTLPKIQSAEMKVSQMKSSQSQDRIRLKPAVPRLNESPILLKGSKQNYVLNNIVTNILSSPTKSLPEPNWINKKEYGQSPKYLLKVKERTLQESQIMKDIYNAQEAEESKKLFQLSQDEIQQLRSGLKSKWNEVFKEYQSLTHLTKVDTIHKKRKKERCEFMLKQLEADMLKLNKNIIFIDTNK